MTRILVRSICQSRDAYLMDRTRGSLMRGTPPVQHNSLAQPKGAGAQLKNQISPDLGSTIHVLVRCNEATIVA